MTGDAHPDGIRSEIELVLLLSQPELSADGVARLRSLTPAVLDWNLVFGLLMMHRVSAIAWRNLVRNGLHHHPAFRPSFALGPVELSVNAQRVAAREQAQRTGALIAEFDRRGIACAVLKGAALARLAYPDPGMRVFADNDILFRRSQLAEVGAVLRGLGYIQGWWDATNRTVRPATRAEILLHSTTSHETFPYTRATPDAQMIDEHQVDVHFSVDLLTSNRNDGTVDDLLERRVRVAVDDTSLWTLHQDDMFIFVCVHFQREACNGREAQALKDLVLYKLVDLLALLDGTAFPVDLAAIAKRAESLGMGREVYFALAYLETLYPGRIPAAVMDQLRPASTDYLDEITYNGVPVHRWDRPILARFFDPLRAAEIGSR